MPVLKHSSDLSGNDLRRICERLGIRSEINPTTFTIDDAELLCAEIERLYGDEAVDPSALRHVIRPAYRSMFELLSGKAGSEASPPLAGSRLLAEQAGNHQFLPAGEVLFASTPGIRERSGLAGSVPLFVLEAEPAALAPLTSVFGCRVLERVLEWRPNPGDSIGISELGEVRQGLSRLVPPLAARIRAERSNTQDLRNLVEFAEQIEPVDELEVTCTLDGEPLNRESNPGYYVRPRTQAEKFQGFIVWVGPGWPPGLDTAQSLAMALADTLGVNLVETFLAFITSDDRQREQLLNIAGGSGHYQDVLDELSEDSDVREELQAPVAEPTAAPESQQPREERMPSGPDVPQLAAPPVPLHSFDSLLLDGEPLIVTGEQTRVDDRLDRSGRSDGSSSTATRSQAPARTDLSALDTLGMQIAVAYEARRLERVRGSVTIIADGILQGRDDSRADDTLVVDVHTPAAIARAERLSDVVKRVMKNLEARGVSRIHPGFDLLSIRGGEIDRLIELKSSGVDARVQAMSWNEWKSASHSDLRARFWLYLVGNLRADLDHASPYVRAINDPFGSLVGETVEKPTAEARRAATRAGVQNR